MNDARELAAAVLAAYRTGDAAWLKGDLQIGTGVCLLGAVITTSARSRNLTPAAHVGLAALVDEINGGAVAAVECVQLLADTIVALFPGRQPVATGTMGMDWWTEVITYFNDHPFTTWPEVERALTRAATGVDMADIGPRKGRGTVPDRQPAAPDTVPDQMPAPVEVPDGVPA